MLNDRAKIKRGQCPACGARGFVLGERQRIECLYCGQQYRLYTEGPVALGGRLLTAYHLKRREQIIPTGRWDGVFKRHSKRNSDTGSPERLSHT